MDNIFHPKKLTAELQAAKLPVAGVSSRGRVDYSRELTKLEAAAAKAIIDAHDPSPTDEEIERALMVNAGISLAEMVMALWTQATQGDNRAVDALAEKIDLAVHGV
jgi:hypothetical protein